MVMVLLLGICVYLLKNEWGLVNVVCCRVRNWLMYYWMMLVFLVLMYIEKLKKLFRVSFIVLLLCGCGGCRMLSFLIMRMLGCWMMSCWLGMML